MWLAASTTTVTSLLLRRFNNKSVSTKSCRAALLLLIHHTSFFTTATTFNSSSKFGGGGGSFILHQQQQANNLHTTTSSPSSSSSSSSSSKFGDTFILQTCEPSVDIGECESSVDLREFGERRDDIKMFMLSSSGSGDGTTGEEEEDKDDDDDDQNKKKKKKKKKKKMVFKLDEDLGFSAIYKDFQLQDSIRMVGSCNGIICLHDPKARCHGRDVYLWNPATRHFRILPESIHIEKQMNYNAFKDFVGFGFDVETQDYKVLRITPFKPDYYKAGDRCMCRVQVYSLSTDSWKLLDGIDSLPVSPTQDPFQNRQGTYLNGTGSCFFLGYKPVNHDGKLDWMFLSFDFTKEYFTIRELPECHFQKLVLSGLSGEELDNRALSCLGDKTVVFRIPVVFRTPRIDFAGGYVFTTDNLIGLYSKGGGYCCHFSMWVMNEQGSRRVVDYKKKLWTKFREFRIKTKTKHFYSEPRCVSNDGELALISTLTAYGRKKWMLFNIVTEKATKDFTIGDRDCRAAYVYKESQVSIMGAGNVLLRWQLPTPGTTYKLNLDAPFTVDYKIFGIGLCLTSDTGGCIGVRSLKRYVSDGEEKKAEALFEAIKWAKELELSPIIIESDSEYGVSFFMEDVDDNYNSTYWSWEALSLLREAKLLLKSSENSISFQYCSRSSNYVAEIASKLARDETTWSCKDWKADSPGEVVMSLSKDLGLETGNWKLDRLALSGV